MWTDLSVTDSWEQMKFTLRNLKSHKLSSSIIFQRVKRSGEVLMSFQKNEVACINFESVGNR